MDLFVVPTIGFELPYGFVIVRIDRRDLVWINVAANPTAEWIARQITEAFPWDGAPGYMIRDRDRIYGAVVHTPIASHGHSGQTDCTGLALAEWLCRTADRIDPARVFGPCHRFGRGTSAPDSNFLCRLLQSCFITRICLCDWGEEVLLIWLRSRGVIWVLPRATNEALSRRFAER